MTTRIKNLQRIGYEFYCEECFVVNTSPDTAVKVQFNSIWMQ